VQLRAPELPDEELLPLAMVLADRCREERVMFVVNNRLDVAAASKADGAHVGQSDDIAGARSVIGPDSVLGVSVRGPEDVPAAEAAGADYLGVTVWETATKPGVCPTGIGVPMEGMGTAARGGGLGAVADARPGVGLGTEADAVAALSPEAEGAGSWFSRTAPSTTARTTTRTA